MKFSFLFAFLFTTTFSFSQFLEDGGYFLTDGGMYQVRITVCEGGLNICYFQFMHDENTIALTETGEWMEVNPNGVDPDYEGPMGWYQTNTPEGDYFELEMVEPGIYKLIFGENAIELYDVTDPESEG
jgi:hypothetical protein